MEDVINKQQFQKEQDKLLTSLLTERYFNPWKNLVRNQDDTSLKLDSALEIYITNKCNQNCSYCYLPKHPELYPPEFNNSETIMKNLKILYDYILVNNFDIPKIDMFTGEIWHLPLGKEVLETTLEYISNGMQIHELLIPSNGTFLLSDEKFQLIQSFIDRFSELGVRLDVSFSIDGKIIDEFNRPRTNHLKYTDDFYDRAFCFAKTNHYGFHPMVSASTVKYWIENYKWWSEQLLKYELDPQGTLMMLEVRNDDWTEDAIKDYCNFITFLMDDFLEHNCNGNKELLARIVGNIRQDTYQEPLIHGYYPWMLPINNSYQGCTVSDHLTVRIGDLAICPCHRTAYDKYLYGYFVVEDGMITGIRAENPYIAIKILMGSTYTSYPICNQCPLNYTCLKGCFGAQIEAQADPFFPIPGVCNFFKRKISCILHHYEELGIIDYLKTITPYEFHTRIAQHILNLYEEDKLNGLGMRG